MDYLLDAAGMARSTFFYHQKRLTAPDKHAELKDAIRDSFQRNKHRYGYRRVLLDLRNQGWVVNHKLTILVLLKLGTWIKQTMPLVETLGYDTKEMKRAPSMNVMRRLKTVV